MVLTIKTVNNIDGKIKILIKITIFWQATRKGEEQTRQQKRVAEGTRKVYENGRENGRENERD